MTALLDTVYGLLYQPEFSDPVNTTITLGYHHDEEEFADEVREHVRRHASKGREQWKKILMGEEVDDDGGEEEDAEGSDDDGFADDGIEEEYDDEELEGDEHEEY